MKKIILILDGMADRPNKALGGKTPLEFAKTPNLDTLFSNAVSGCVQTIPDGEEAGSAVANLNLLGYETKKVYKGRAVIEAAGADIEIDQDSLYIRTNFVTLKGNSFNDSVIESYSAFELEDDEAKPLVDLMNTQLFESGFELKHTGSFRNVLVCKDKTQLLGKLNFMPPHDIIGKSVKDNLSDDNESKAFFELMRKSYDLLSAAPSNANALWFWGVSVCPDLSEQNSDQKAILAETILMKGIANLMGARRIVTDESHGFKQFLIDKADAAIKTVKDDNDFIYVHIQKTDDLSHELQPLEKAEALTAIDKYFLAAFLDGIQDEDYALVVASDHYTFSDDGSHGRAPAPFIFYRNKKSMQNKFTHFTEKNCVDSHRIITPKQLHEMF